MNTPLGKTRVEAEFVYHSVAEWKILVVSKAYTSSASFARILNNISDDFQLLFDLAEYIPQPEISAGLQIADYVMTLYTDLFWKASSKKEKYIVSQLNRYHYPDNRGQPIVFSVLTSIYEKVLGKEQAVKAKKIIAYDR